MTNPTVAARVAIQRLKSGAFVLFPALLVFGKLCSYVMQPNYFSDKHNVFNQYFVKLGWLWTTLAFWLPYLTWPTKPIPGLNKPGLKGVVARYLAATIWWIFFAQWFFGPPVMDRIFVLSGGSCVVETGELKVSSSTRCRAGGGQWIGGHDPSGHFFLLMESTMLLVQENLPYLYYLFTAEDAYIPLSFKFTLSLLTLWIWMFFITSVYFHSFLEKLSGLAFGYVEIIFVYYMGEYYPWGSFFGIHELDAEAIPKNIPVETAES